MERCRHLRRPTSQFASGLPALLGYQFPPWAEGIQNPHPQTLPFPEHSLINITHSHHLSSESIPKLLLPPPCPPLSVSHCPSQALYLESSLTPLPSCPYPINSRGPHPALPLPGKH